MLEKIKLFLKVRFLIILVILTNLNSILIDIKILFNNIIYY